MRIRCFLLFLLAWAFLMSVVSCAKEDCRSKGADVDFSAINTKSLSKTETESDRGKYDVSFREAELVAKKLSEGKDLVKLESYDYEGDTLFFVAQYVSGYKIISGDKRASLFLMEAEEGTFSMKEDGEFNAPAFWITDLAAGILLLKRGDAKPRDSANILFWRAVIGDNTRNAESPTFMTRVDSVEFEDPDHVWVQVPLFSYDSTSYINTVDHILPTKWGQSDPWNKAVPYTDSTYTNHCPTGCSAVAMAQVIYYCHFNLLKPNWLFHGAHYSGCYNAIPPSWSPGTYVDNSTRWDSMAACVDSSYSVYSSDYVGEFMADIGHTINMHYSPSKSGAFITEDGFNHYDILCDSGSFNQSIIESNLRANQPVAITAYASRDWSFGYHYYDGHSWVIDGITTKKVDHINVYEWRTLSELGSTQYLMYSEAQALLMEPNLFSGKRIYVTTSSYSDFYKMNWGWSGSHDDELFGTGSNNWTVTLHDQYGNPVDYNYQYNKKIWYDYR